MDRAEYLYKTYECSYYFMSLDGVLDEYKSYNIDDETEEKWMQEFIEENISSITAKNACNKVLKIYHLGREATNEKQLEKLFNTVNKIYGISDQEIIMICEDMQQMVRRGYRVDKEKTKKIIKNLINRISDADALDYRFIQSYNALNEYCDKKDEIDEIALNHLILQLSINIGEITNHYDNKDIVLQKAEDTKLILECLKKELNIK